MLASGYDELKKERKIEIFYVTVGPQVENVVLGLSKGNEDYDGILKIADGFFELTKDTTYETLQFRKMQQEPHETLDEFVVRLKHQAKSCGFNDTEAQVRLQVISGARSSTLRRRILEENWDLDSLLKKARQADVSAEHAVKIESECAGASRPVLIKQEVAKLEPRAIPYKEGRRAKAQGDKRNEARCFKCGGAYPHRDKPCPAAKEKCRRCHRLGHYERCCKEQGERDRRPREQVRALESRRREEEPEERDWVWSVTNDEGERETAVVDLCGSEVAALLDTGATVSVINRLTYQRLRDKPTLKPLRRKTYAFGQIELVKMLDVNSKQFLAIKASRSRISFK